MGAWGWWVVLASLTGGVHPGSGGAAPRAEGGPDLVRVAHQATAGTLREALRGAERRLERERCQSVFTHFRDRTGRPLLEPLDRTGQTPGSYLRQVLFYDGSRHPLCETDRVLAVASPGNRVVRVCPEAIRYRYHRDPRYVEAILIHEALHTLGLGENPPSSFEITSQVIRRCTR